MSPFSQLRQQAGLSISETAERMGFNERTVYRWENGVTSPRKPVIELLQSLVDTRTDSPKPAAFTFIDLFAGIGGLRRGFEPIGGKCVFTSEWDRFSQETYRANYVCDHELAGDITKIEAGDIPKHDVLLAGFPCQPFSLAGVSKKNSLNRPHGFQCDVQGTLFFDVARIIKHHAPKAFLLENVKNLKSHDKGRTFEIIMKTLEEDLGYTVKTRIVDARSWVPQHRERIFIVGFKDANSFTFDDFVLPPSGQNPSMKQILHPEDGSEPDDQQFTDAKGNVLSRYTLSDHLWGYLRGYAETHRLKGNGFGFGLVGPDGVARTLSARYHKDGSEILVQQEGKNPRRLTPRECARLMGFEKPGENKFKIRVSDTQAYRQFGNAVVVPVVKAVARHMAPWLAMEDAGDEPKQRKSLPLPDVVDQLTRSRMMSGIKGKDTKPELAVRRGLHSRGFRYRLHASDLPGNPDLVLPRFRAAIFVNGCFWHRHDCHLFRVPSTRQEFWTQKIERNLERDAVAREKLRNAEWRFLIVWECALKGRTRIGIDEVIERIATWLVGSEPSMEIEGAR